MVALHVAVGSKEIINIYSMLAEGVGVGGSRIMNPGVLIIITLVILLIITGTPLAQQMK